MGWTVTVNVSLTSSSSLNQTPSGVKQLHTVFKTFPEFFQRGTSSLDSMVTLHHFNTFIILLETSAVYVK